MRPLVLLGTVLGLVAPHATITGGPPAQTPDTSGTFTFSASGPAPLGSFQCTLDDGAWGPCTSPDTVRGLGGGPHSFQVRLTGPLTDPTPDRRDWTVQQQTVVTPPPLPPATT